ncbi:869_t:CDS:2, partial [Gigaspora margarita]
SNPTCDSGVMYTRQIFYIEKEWKSDPLCPSDCIVSLKGVKSQEKVLAKELLIETLIREAVLVNNIKSPEIPPDFLMLINNEIIKADCIKSKTKDLNEQLWLSLGQWLGMEEPLTRRNRFSNDFIHHTANQNMMDKIISEKRCN